MELLLRLFGCVSKVINLILRPFLILIYDGFRANESIPKSDEPILDICAVDLAEKIRTREVSIMIWPSVECNYVHQLGLYGVKSSSQRSIDI